MNIHLSEHCGFLISRYLTLMKNLKKFELLRVTFVNSGFSNICCGLRFLSKNKQKDIESITIKEIKKNKKN